MIAHQALNECLYGFGLAAAGDVPFGPADGRQLMDSLGAAYEAGKSFEVGPSVNAAICAALDATSRELDWGYSTRMGVDIVKVQALRETLGRAQR